VMRPTVHLVEPVLREVTEAIDCDFERVDALAGADGVVAMLTVRVDDAFFDAAGPQLRVVANYAVGVDNVDLEAARRRGIVVTNTPDVLTPATAEIAIGLTLALLRRIAEGDRFVRSAEPWRFSLEFMLGSGLAGKTLLVVGPGRIGREVARLAEAFGARTTFAARGDDLDTLLADADIVSINCPSTAETHHLFDAARLARMKPTAMNVRWSRLCVRRRLPVRRWMCTSASRRWRTGCARSTTSCSRLISAAQRERPGLRWGCSASKGCARCCSRTASRPMQWSCRDRVRRGVDVG
jgi:lactate dehydrogenase-like 2-hydroxyacid dehydrogenase